MIFIFDINHKIIANIVYIYNNNKYIYYYNKVRFGNCLGEGRSRAYQVVHSFMITRRTNYIGI